MRKHFWYLLILIPFLNYAQVENKQIREIEKLQSLCKVWGFLKYYHPNVANGRFDWDEELIQAISKVKEIDNKDELSNFYIEWIDNLGKIKGISIKATNNNFNKNFDLSWMNKTEFFSDLLKKQLKNIENNRYQGKPYYVKLGKNGEIQMINEKKYIGFEFPSEDYRLLNLFRFWNIIEYFYPHKYMMDFNWDVTLKDMTPLFINSSTKLEYQLAMNQLVCRLNDGHAFFSTQQINKYFGRKYLPFLLTYDKSNNAVITKILNDSLVKLNNIVRGDILIKFNGTKISTIFENTKKYIKASNIKAKYIRLSNTALRSNDSAIIEINRKGKIITNKIALYSSKKYYYGSTSKTKWEILNNNIGYINTANVDVQEVSSMMKDIGNTNALIVDIRYSPKYLTYSLLRHLSKEKSIFSLQFTPNISYPGKFHITEQKTGKKNKNYYKGDIVILVNENTMSRGEYLAMALQSLKNTYTIGRQTAGADGESSTLEFVGGYQAKFTGVGILYPYKDESQRKGVKIDKIVEFSLDDFIKGEDTILNKAIGYINNKNE